MNAKALQAAEPGQVLTLEGCLARQTDRRQMGVVAYDHRAEDSNFGEQLANLTPAEQLRCALVGACMILAGGFGVLVLVEGLRRVSGMCVHLSHWL